MARYLSKEPAWGIDLQAEFPVSTLNLKTAAFPFEKEGDGMGGGGPPPDMGGGEGGRRNIPKDHPYDQRSLKPLAKALWASSVSMGHALTAYRYLSRLKSSTISPDGMLGGRGYIQKMDEMRKKLHSACEALSSITDTMFDEITAPHWKSRLAQLDENDAEDVERFVEESKAILENPEEDAEEEAKQIEEENDDGEDEEDDEGEGASKVPDGGDLAADQVEKTPMGESPSAPTSKQKMARKANSSLPVETMPGGPRIQHLDREDQDPNPQDAYTNDGWGLPGPREYDYPSAWDNNLNENQASSAVPDSTSESTPTEAWDFGLGYGARGQGAGGYENPSGEGDGTKGVFGPASGMPGTPAGSSGDTTPALDSATNNHQAQGQLPNDEAPPVARSDYYRGDRGNLVNTQSLLPGEASPKGEMSPGLLNTDYTTEDVETPYVRYDYTTHDYRDDPLHNWPQSHLAGTNEDV